MPSILVIDDDPLLRSFARVALERGGYAVREAADGADGLLALEQEPADLVLCDVFMPGESGLGVLRHLRHRCRRVKVVAMSGGSPRFAGDFLGVARRLGAVGALAKPFGVTELLGAVESALAG
jgi:CheY-like chemotaxis protein